MTTRNRVMRSLAAALGVVGSIAIIAFAQQNADYEWGVAFLGFLVMGALVLWHQPTNRIGWVMWAIGLLAAGEITLQWYSTSSVGPGPVAVEMIVLPLGIVMFALLIVLVAVFPEGRPAGPWERRLVTTVVAVVLPIVLVTVVSPRPLDSGRRSPFAIGAAETWVRILVDDSFVVVPVAFGLAVASLAMRWRRAKGPQRAQFKWLTLGAVVTLAVLASTFVVSDSSWLNSVLVLGLAALPACIGIAISRYHLYDIDRIVSRTTSYAIVTGVVLATYAVVVTSVTRLLPDASKLAVAAATLAAAAVARPLHRRVQHAVDRRFDRARYDAQHTIDDFGMRLRQEVDTQLVSQDLLSVVHRTLQPDGAALWLRERT